MGKMIGFAVISIIVWSAGPACCGGFGKQQSKECPEACQQQIDGLNSSQSQQNGQLDAHGKQLENHETRIGVLEKDHQDFWYARVGVRSAWMVADVTDVFNSQDSGPGFGGAVAFGREIGYFRAEIELAHQKTEADTYNTREGASNVSYDVDAKLTTIMINGYYEQPLCDALSVYGMAGIGYAKYDLDTIRNGNDIGGSDNVFAYKAGLGLSYELTEEMETDLGYEYLGVADTDLATSINGHNIVASFRYKF